VPAGAGGLFQSLTVDEHFQSVGREGERRLDAQRVYDLFPRAGRAQGRQRHVALGRRSSRCSRSARALLTNPKLLIMDEPSEGLAPTIVEGLVQTIKDLALAGMGLLVVEQNLGVATSLAERQLVMGTGAIATETTAEALMADPAAQRRYLGVEPLPDAA
jgi:branched-chain amino acid transport system ATP-binding protein